MFSNSRQARAGVALAVALLCVLIAACGGPRSSVRRDGPPDTGAVPANIASIPDAEWRAEPLARFGNPVSYRVDGDTYYVSRQRKAYKARGYASWYGKQFHGERTSSGETYDMYKMTAAHKTLPIPAFVRVTNLKNRRSVVLRVNDRGPFVDDRIIDVSYTAAVKLGMISAGTAYVEVEALLGPSEPPHLQVASVASTASATLPDYTEQARADQDALRTAPLDGPPSPAVIQIRNPAPPPDLPARARREEVSIAAQHPALEATEPESFEEVAPAPELIEDERDPEPEPEPATLEEREYEEGLRKASYEPAPPARVQRTPRSESLSGWFLQAGAFGSRLNAQKLIDRLQRAGLALAFLFELAEDGLYRVRLGPYADEMQLAEDRARLEDMGIAPRTLRE